MNNGKSSYCRFLEGERDAIINVVSEYHSGLVLYLNTITGSICVSEEIAEDVFCELMLKKPDFSEKSSFKTWLYAIARHLALKMMKKYRNLDTMPFDEHYELADEQNIESGYIKGEQKSMLNKALKNLRTEYSQVLYLIYFEEFSNSETARIMKKNNRQIENLIYRAKNALRKELEKEGFVYEEL